MTFMGWIIQGLNDASDFFYSVYLKVNSWVYPFWQAASFFYSLSLLFSDLAWDFYDFNTWITDATAKLGQILNINAITSYFQTWINYATQAWNWILNAISNVTNIVGAWWNSTSSIVQAWIEAAKQWALAQINNLASAMVEIQTWWNSFKSNLPTLNEIFTWFSNWWANILSKLNAWWNERLLDIKALFDSWALSLAPFWEGWQEVRENVFDFLNNPFEWLLSRFVDWFLGGE